MREPIIFQQRDFLFPNSASSFLVKFIDFGYACDPDVKPSIGDLLFQLELNGNFGNASLDVCGSDSFPKEMEAVRKMGQAIVDCANAAINIYNERVAALAKNKTVIACDLK